MLLQSLQAHPLSEIASGDKDSCSYATRFLRIARWIWDFVDFFMSWWIYELCIAKGSFAAEQCRFHNADFLAIQTAKRDVDRLGYEWHEAGRSLETGCVFWRHVEQTAGDSERVVS